MGLKIAIVGAGPAGCVLARLLSQSPHYISVTIFESEASLNFRSQGGTLDLHEQTGQAAIKKAGLWEEFLKHARYDGEAMKICDKNLLCYVKQGAPKNNSPHAHSRPEIDRPLLRELLFNSLPPNTVEWNKKLVSVSKEDLTLHFADGTTATGYDLIVGADGAWSHVRAALTDDRPYYSGIAGHSMLIPNAQATHPDLYNLVNRGSCFAFSDGKSVMSQYMGDGSINVQTWSVRPQTWQSEFDVHSPGATKQRNAQDYADWHPSLVALTQEIEDKVTPRDLCMLPVGNRWHHVPGITLVGDASHVMTPFAGEGVNLALKDSLKLSEAIIAAASSLSSSSSSSSPPSPSSSSSSPSSPLDAGIRAFEQDMFVRAKSTQQLTKDLMDAMFFTPGAPRNGIETYIIRAVGDEMGPWMTMAMTPIVWAYFFVFKCIW